MVGRAPDVLDERGQMPSPAGQMLCPGWPDTGHTNMLPGVWRLMVDLKNPSTITTKEG